LLHPKLCLPFRIAAPLADSPCGDNSTITARFACRQRPRESACSCLIDAAGAFDQHTMRRE
jgi:hypothetical protein